ncbi:hypothetical protein K402DRAFT_353866 [Aulographum hederae CBS 113979]|uniref:D-aminoacyl-tRNA deacylase n=1 Tax=Aulographum hederae CBS 113979 TaxID=1176131 RepID=A0A6G1H3C2_9PEZI|nr:hypothetical protein K402DRAFT_353866 [Aulographum hederae CBS 113979]
MKAVLQRVKSASVSVDDKLISAIGKGILVFAAVDKDDTVKDAEKAAAKLLTIRLWDDEESGGRWKKNVKDVDGDILCVSQFTLLASTKKGNKPDFHKSAPAEKAKELYKTFFRKVQELHGEEKVKDGIFQAMMDVSLVNDGPVGVNFESLDGAVTLEIDTMPPEMDTPGVSGSGGVATGEHQFGFGDLTGNMQKISKTFEIPAELLE